jgi:hypothetical protein
MDWALAFFIGMGTSLIELFSRYRDEPLKVIATSQFAWVYLLLNGLMAIGAHAVLLDSGFTTIETPTSRASLAVGSGISAALILRSRVFEARLGDEQVSIGPGYIVDQLLGIIDAQIDRRRALQRVSIVVSVMDGKDFDGSRIHASTMITGSRQNLSLQEQKDLANQIREVVDRKIPDQEKSYALGFILLDFMGEEFLQAVAARLPSIEQPAITPPTFVANGITDTGTGTVAKRTWGASLPVQRARIVREVLTGFQLEAVRAHTMQLIDNGELGASEDERILLRQQIADVLARPASDEDKVFAIGFAVHSLCNSSRFREAYAELRGKPTGSHAVVPPSAAAAEPAEQDDDEDEDESEQLDVSMTGLDAEDSGSGRPKTGSHPALKLNAGPLPIAKDRGRPNG